VLPAFVLGLVMSRHYQRHRNEQQRLRVVAFAFLTPFFFLRGGLNVSLSAVAANLGLLGVLFAAKMVPKIGLVLPLARRYVPQPATFTTLLMSTGLTFGTISIDAYDAVINATIALARDAHDSNLRRAGLRPPDPDPDHRRKLRRPAPAMDAGRQPRRTRRPAP
jgi:Kef-type K+ transport system membrane component KefB